jgi:hypothetical protein
VFASGTERFAHSRAFTFQTACRQDFTISPRHPRESCFEHPAH